MIEPNERIRNPALVIVDMQNDFVRVGAPLEVPDARATIPAHQALLARFRERRLPVVFTRFITFPAPSLLWEWSPQVLPPTKCCWKGHRRFYSDIGAERDCTEIIDELAPLPGEHLIDKFGYGAFHGTALDTTLRALGVQSLVVTGTVTQICVEETAREAFHHGYRTTLARDAVSSYLPDLHAATLKNFAHKFGWVENSETLLGQLAQAACDT